MNAGCGEKEDVCSGATCRDCTIDERCGWCEEEQQCMRGLKDGPCDGICKGGWESKICPSIPCGDHKTCTACVEDSFCGFCATTGTCHDGSKEDPFLATCDDWRHFDCPMVKFNLPMVEEKVVGGPIDETSQMPA